MSPTAPRRPCNQPMCPELTTSTYCQAHQRKRYRDQARYRRSTKEAGYTGSWRKLRRMVLNRDPICKACHRAPSDTAHHIIPKPEGPNTMENLVGWCKACHSAHHMRERA